MVRFDSVRFAVFNSKADGANLSVAARAENIDGLLKPEMEINLYYIVQN